MSRIDPPVTVRVTQKVKADHLPAIEDKLGATLALAAEADGFLGANVIKLRGSDGDRLDVLIRFASLAQLDSWRKGDQARRAFAEKGVQLVEPVSLVLEEGSVSWSDLPDAKTVTMPPKWKMAIITWLAIFPTLTIFLWVTRPLFGPMPLVVRIFFNTIMIAPLMTWVIMPQMTRLFRAWLFATSRGPG